MKEYVENGIGIVENFNPNIILNMAGDNFEPMAYLGLLAPDKDYAVQDEFNDVDGYQLRAPTASGVASG